MKLGRNYWKLWVASVVANFGDGIGIIAYPWLASAITRDGFRLGLVVLATRLPWLLFSLPAGVIGDRVDRRRLIVGMDAARAVLTLGVAVLVVAFSGPLEAAEPMAGPTGDFLLAALVLSSFLYGTAEVLRDNTAQTILPSVVDKGLLEKANGRLWGAELVANSFLGPPLAGVLIGIALAVPFFVHSGSLIVAGAMMALLAGEFRPRTDPGPRPRFRAQLAEGFAWLWSHRLFRPMALALGVMNGATALTAATYVLFAQEILGLGPSAFGILMTSGAVGGVIGSVVAPKVAEKLGKARSLQVTMAGGVVTMVVTALTSSAVVVWTMFLLYTTAALLWNVITVSLRQRAIPDRLLGRVNSVYRFFGWGMMSIGALVGGAVVSLAEPSIGREMALRSPFLVAAGLQLAIWVLIGPKLNSAAIAETEASVERASAVE